MFGYDTGTISGIKVVRPCRPSPCRPSRIFDGRSSIFIQMKDWLRTFGAPSATSATGYGITPSQESLVVSILSAGTFFGALLGAPMADFVGRKWGIVLSCLVLSVGVAMQIASTKMALFVVGRVFAGLGTLGSVMSIVWS